LVKFACESKKLLIFKEKCDFFWGRRNYNVSLFCWCCCKCGYLDSTDFTFSLDQVKSLLIGFEMHSNHLNFQKRITKFIHFLKLQIFLVICGCVVKLRNILWPNFVFWIQAKYSNTASTLNLNATLKLTLSQAQTLF